MNAFRVALVTLAVAASGAAAQDAVSANPEPALLVDAVIRGQSPGATIYDPPPVGLPPTYQFPLAQLGPALGTQLPAPGAVPGGMSVGVHSSLQPYRLNGWTGRVSGGYLPKEGTGGQLGSMGITELDVELEYSTLFMPGWIFSFTQLLDMRWWDGPSDPGVDGPPIIPGNGLPSRAYRVGWDLELATSTEGAYSAQLAFTPSLATDFDSTIDSNSWQFDGRVILFYKYPGMTVALGAGYWDRVQDRVIPYAGIIFKPDAIWEWQLMFPQSRISVFLGNFGGTSSWMYTTAEYNVESYQVSIHRTHGAAPVADQVEFEDYRLLLGFRSEAMQYSSFIEAGWVFSRDVRFRGATPGFDIADGFIARAGVSF